MVKSILCRYSCKKQKVIEEYIKNQIQEDLAYEQMSSKDHLRVALICKDINFIRNFNSLNEQTNRFPQDGLKVIENMK
ncbi:hypothetical protein UT300007_20470 [Clostridium sp. CTA-7]